MNFKWESSYHANPDAPLQTHGGAGLFPETPLQYAIHNGNSHLADLLLKAGAHVDAKSSAGRTALHFAVAEQKLDMIRFLLNRGADVNVRDKEGAAPLDDAAWNGDLDTAAILLANGAHLDEPDGGTGATPLNEAAFRGYVQLLRYFLQFSPDLDAADKRGFTPLDNAIRMGKEDCALLLLAATPKDSQTTEFLSKTLEAALRKDEPLLTDTLLRRGLSPNAALASGSTPLDAAAFNGAAKSAASLLNNGADPNLAGANGIVPLNDAALKGFDAIVTLLLDHGEQLNRIDAGLGTTALYSAASFGKQSTVKLLLDHGANPNLCGANHKTPWQVALDNGYKEVAAELQDHGGAKGCLP